MCQKSCEEELSKTEEELSKTEEELSKTEASFHPAISASVANCIPIAI